MASNRQPNLRARFTLRARDSQVKKDTRGRRGCVGVREGGERRIDVSPFFPGALLKRSSAAEQAGFNCAAATPAGQLEMSADEDKRIQF